jgi:hypothetical protein
MTTSTYILKNAVRPVANGVFREYRPKPTHYRAMPEPVARIYVGPPLRDQTSLAGPSTWEPPQVILIGQQSAEHVEKCKREELSENTKRSLAFGRNLKADSLAGKVRAIMLASRYAMTADEIMESLPNSEHPPKRKQVASTLADFVARGWARKTSEIKGRTQYLLIPQSGV